MSRFEVDYDKVGKITLSTDSLRNLMDNLYSAYSSLLRSIAVDTMKSMALAGCNYRLITVQDYVIVINKTMQPAAELSTGYPFPIYTTSLNADWNLPYKCRFFIRGALFRDAQRSYLLDSIGHNSRVVHVSRTDSSDYFFHMCKEAVRSEMQHGSKLYYFDFYHFIGDSILSMYILKVLIDCFHVNASDVVVYSRHESHLAIPYEKRSYARFGDSDQLRGIIILPSLLDIDEWDSVNVLKNVQSGVCLFISRNDLFVRNSSKQLFLSLDVDDVLLRNQNIFEYMNECVYPFTHGIIQTPLTKCSKPIRKIFLNPNASISDKALSNSLLSNILEAFPNIRFIVPKGFDVASTQRASICAHFDNVSLVSTSHIAELVYYALETDLVISPDTSVAHACVQQGLQCITVFYDGFWDKKSMQSLSAESPIGFCSPFKNQLPIVVNRKNENMVLNLVKYLINHSSADFPTWDSGLYSLSENFSGKEQENIARIIERISLERKLQT